MTMEDDKARWEAMSSHKDLEVKGSVRTPLPISSSALTSRLKELTNMAALDEFHEFPSVHSAVAIGTLFTETMGLDGHKITSGCICTLEAADGTQQLFNLTVRTSIATVSQCVFEATKQAFEARERFVVESQH